MGAFSLTRLAKADLRNIAGYTERKWGRKQRKYYFKEMDGAFKILANAPVLGAMCDHIDKGLRKHPLQSHIIYYEITHKTSIQIVRVLHKSMDVEKASFSS